MRVVYSYIHELKLSDKGVYKDVYDIVDFGKKYSTRMNELVLYFYKNKKVLYEQDFMLASAISSMVHSYEVFGSKRLKNKHQWTNEYMQKRDSIMFLNVKDLLMYKKGKFIMLSGSAHAINNDLGSYGTYKFKSVGRLLNENGFKTISVISVYFWGKTMLFSKNAPECILNESSSLDTYNRTLWKMRPDIKCVDYLYISRSSD